MFKCFIFIKGNKHSVIKEGNLIHYSEGLNIKGKEERI